MCFRFRPSIKILRTEIFIGPLKILVQFLVCFRSFTEKKLFASSVMLQCLNFSYHR